MNQRTVSYNDAKQWGIQWTFSPANEQVRNNSQGETQCISENKSEISWIPASYLFKHRNLSRFLSTDFSEPLFQNRFVMV